MKILYTALLLSVLTLGEVVLNSTSRCHAWHNFWQLVQNYTYQQYNLSAVIEPFNWTFLLQFSIVNEERHHCIYYILSCFFLVTWWDYSFNHLQWQAVLLNTILYCLWGNVPVHTSTYITRGWMLNEVRQDFFVAKLKLSQIIVQMDYWHRV